MGTEKEKHQLQLINRDSQPRSSLLRRGAAPTGGHSRQRAWIVGPLRIERRSVIARASSASGAGASVANASVDPSCSVASSPTIAFISVSVKLGSSLK